jgi:hypothetical protein
LDKRGDSVSLVVEGDGSAIDEAIGERTFSVSAEKADIGTVSILGVTVCFSIKRIFDNLV